MPSQATTDRRRAQGLCIRCGKVKARPNRATCQPCMDYQLEYNMRYRGLPNPTKVRRQEAGLCINCGKGPPRPNLSTCQPCATIKAARARSRKRKRKAQGLCVECGKRPARPNRVTCGPCADRGNTTLMGRRDKRKAKGLCVECGEQPIPGQTRCRACADMNLGKPTRKRSLPVRQETWDYDAFPFTNDLNPDPWRPGGSGEVAMYMIGTP